MNGNKPRCKHRCKRPDFACEHCAPDLGVLRVATPARKDDRSLDIIADTGSEEDLISISDLKDYFEDDGIKVESSPVNLYTANGTVEASSRTQVNIPALGSKLEFVELLDTPPVCSVGKKCMEQGYGFYWPPGQLPYFVKPDGNKLQCDLRGNVPVFSSSGKNSGSPATVAANNESGKMAPTCSVKQGFQ